MTFAWQGSLNNNKISSSKYYYIKSNMTNAGKGGSKEKRITSKVDGLSHSGNECPVVEVPG